MHIYIYTYIRTHLYVWICMYIQGKKVKTKGKKDKKLLSFADDDEAPGAEGVIFFKF